MMRARRSDESPTCSGLTVCRLCACATPTVRRHSSAASHTVFLFMSTLRWGSVTARARFPEVVMDAAGADEAPERHHHAITDLHRLRIDVGHLALEPAAALEVDHRDHDRR